MVVVTARNCGGDIVYADKACGEADGSLRGGEHKGTAIVIVLAENEPSATDDSALFSRGGNKNRDVVVLHPSSGCTVSPTDICGRVGERVNNGLTTCSA